MATLRNKTGSEGVIVLWKPYPDHGRPSTYQVTNRAVSLLGDLGFKVPNRGDEVDIPWDICRPLRVLGDLHFKSETQGEVEVDDIGNVKEDYAQDLSEEQRQHLKEYISNHKNYQYTTNELGEEISSLSSENTTSEHEDRIDESDIYEGSRLTTKIDRISSSGNGIIKTHQHHINIGPVKQYSKGREIEIEVVTDSFAICATKEVRSENYAKNFWRINPDVFYKYGRETIESAEFCPECGSVVLTQTIVNPPEVLEDLEKWWSCSICDTKSIFLDQSGDAMVLDTDNRRHRETSGGEIPNLPKVGEIINGVTLTIGPKENICAEADQRIKVTGSSDLRKKSDVKIRVERDGYVVGTVINESRRASSEESSLNELRERAREAASDTVDTTVKNSSSETTQYSRSSEVKKYVKARASGNCEGCGDSAPFTSKTGKPYLHTHHIQELSDGSSDTPDTVVALCPNCHYQVHHGENGDEYNRELLAKIKAKEHEKV